MAFSPLVFGFQIEYFILKLCSFSPKRVKSGLNQVTFDLNQLKCQLEKVTGLVTLRNTVGIVILRSPIYGEMTALCIG